MHIFVDESGTFTQSPHLESWCVVAGYVAPEHKRRDIAKLISQIRAIGNNGAETKLKNLTEDQYIWFLKRLRALDGLAFSVAVDVGLHRSEAIVLHRNRQADKVIEHREKMMHESARQGLTELSNQIRSLPTQLYTQLVCQLELFHLILTRAPLYFVQRHPPSLGHFRWRLDQKARVPTDYEESFHKMLPVILQTMSLTDPMLMLEGADYRHFSRFDYSADEEPTYLKDCYGIESRGGSNIGKMIQEDFQLADSATTPGLQISDLIASGIRRLLRGSFDAEDQIALLIGANMVQCLKDENPIKLITLDQTANVSPRAAHLIELIASTGRPMLAK